MFSKAACEVVCLGVRVGTECLVHHEYCPAAPHELLHCTVLTALCCLACLAQCSEHCIAIMACKPWQRLRACCLVLGCIADGDTALAHQSGPVEHCVWSGSKEGWRKACTAGDAQVLMDLWSAGNKQQSVLSRCIRRYTRAACLVQGCGCAVSRSPFELSLSSPVNSLTGSSWLTPNDGVSQVQSLRRACEDAMDGWCVMHKLNANMGLSGLRACPV